MTRTNWMENKTMPDSIMTKIRDLPPVTPRNLWGDFSAELLERWTCRNTLKILHTIKPVIRAFTAMEMATLVIAKVEAQRFV